MKKKDYNKVIGQRKSKSKNLKAVFNCSIFPILGQNGI